jgi:hypothetical protein
MPSAKLCTKCGTIIIGGTKCFACGSGLIPIGSPIAQKIIAETGQAADAQKAVVDAKRKTKTNGKILMICGGIGVLLVMLAIRMQDSDQTNTTGTSASTTSSDDAQLLLARCGPPSLDDSTAYDYPRPPIPSRTIEYRKAMLRVMFIPADSALGDPPPYRWKLIGITDMSARNPANARVVPPDEAVKRLPCWKPQ